jgi:CO/xanthine dehydrogenase Mo-binding subunit
MVAQAVDKKTPHPIGDSVQRVDAREKVLGSAVFADDLQFGTNLLYARIKRSALPHALIKRIDASRARALPGVKAVVTGEDTPGFIGLYLQDRHIFCRERARYVGDPIAGVAATSEEIAEKALDLIEIEYEPLPGVFDPEWGASLEAPLLHPDLGKYEAANFIFPKPGTNISNHFRIRKGDVDAAWSECAAIVEHKYRIPHIQHVPIEPHIAIARADEDGLTWGEGSAAKPG